MPDPDGTMAPLLVEIGTEELPTRAIRPLGEALLARLRERLTERELTPAGGRWFATPRRIAAYLDAVPVQQPDQQIERRGPALTAAFDAEGRPTQAAEGFARSCGVAVEALERLETAKGRWLVYRREQPGQGARELLPEILREAAAALPVPRAMRWGRGEAAFARPVHWLVVLHGTESVPASLFGQTGQRATRGHRFHAPRPLTLREPGEYAEALEGAYVVADFAARRQRIEADVTAAARHVGGRAVIDPDLLEEVTGLVEWPVAIAGSFDPAFLEVPPEVLISAMQDHQRYFPLVDAEDRLLPRFIAVANLASRDPTAVRIGNERVIRPRFADAQFFWDQDRKRALSHRAADLAQVVFTARLGTLADKTERLRGLGGQLAEVMGADPSALDRATQLAKCDLLTEMVGEFPELQGIMGAHYARHDGEIEGVAQAIADHYRPRFAGDAIPAGPVSQALALADRLDTLVGIFASGQRPTGVKDPFGLRRAALGVVRLLIEARQPVDLEEALTAAARRFPSELNAESAVGDTFEFIMERLRRYYTDQGVAADTFEAVSARRPTRPLDFDDRVRAVQLFRTLPEAQALAAADKRIRNILRKSEEALPASAERSRLDQPAEQALAAAIEAQREAVRPLFETGAYETGLRRLAGLREPVDAFFDGVLVMAEDAGVRRNRLALLRELNELFAAVADISRLQI